MSNDTTIGFHDPVFADELTNLVRDGAQRIIREAVQAELEAYLVAFDDTDAAGRRAVVRNPPGQERTARHLAGRHAGRGRAGVRPIPGYLRGQISEGHRVPGQGP